MFEENACAESLLAPTGGSRDTPGNICEDCAAPVGGSAHSPLWNRFAPTVTHEVLEAIHGLKNDHTMQQQKMDEHRPNDAALTKNVCPPLSQVQRRAPYTPAGGEAAIPPWDCKNAAINLQYLHNKAIGKSFPGLTFLQRAPDLHSGGIIDGGSLMEIPT